MQLGIQYQIVTQAVTLSGGSWPDSFSISAPAGMLVVGGGIDSGLATGATIHASYPSEDGSAWHVGIKQDGSSTSATVYAVCVAGS